MAEFDRLDRALLLAAKAHSGQRRDGEHGLPYAIHPFEVVSNLRYVGNIVDEDLLVSGALHDVLEETDVEPATIRRKFGKRASELVLEVTRKEPTKKEIKGLTEEEIWQLRSSLLLTEIAQMSRDARTIKLADRLSNLQDANRVKVGEKLQRYRTQSYEILETIPEEVNPSLWCAVRKLLA